MDPETRDELDQTIAAIAAQAGGGPARLSAAWPRSAARRPPRHPRRPGHPVRGRADGR
jgi:hypothetical protein